MLRRYLGFVSAALAFGLAGANGALAANSCSALANIKIADTTITAAESVAAGTFKAPDQKNYSDLPAFCRVTATISALPNSAVRIELWMPQQGWKGLFEGTGNGGYGGDFIYSALAQGVRRGYAAANTDQGTAPAHALDGDTMVGHPVKWGDWGFRATHQMTEVGKEIVSAFYGKAPSHSYFSGCSTGGQQGLIEAQKYPDDYDGIAAGAPAINRTHLHAAFVWDHLAAQRSPGASLTSDKLGLLKKAVVAACAPGAGGAEIGHVRRRSPELPLRPRVASVQGGRRRGLPHSGSG